MVFAQKEQLNPQLGRRMKHPASVLFANFISIIIIIS